MPVDGVRPCVLMTACIFSSSASLLESSLICPSTTRFFISAPVAESADALVSGPVTSLKKTRVFWEASITVLTPHGVFSFSDYILIYQVLSFCFGCQVDRGLLKVCPIRHIPDGASVVINLY